MITLENVHEFTGRGSTSDHGGASGRFSPYGDDSFTVNVVSSYAARGASEQYVL